MKTFLNLVEAIDDLRSRGYTSDFDLKPDLLESAALEVKLHPADFEITEVHRFEGPSSADDSCVLFAIKGKSGLKGIALDAYGVYSNALQAEMLAKLRIRH